MNPKLKLTAYALLLILSAWFGHCFFSNYSLVTNAAAAAAAADSGADAPAAAPDTSTNTNSPVNTNTATNLLATPDSNNPASSTTNAVATVDTNAPAIQSNAPAPPRRIAKKPAAKVDVSAARGAMIGYLAALVGSLIGLGLLIAHDVTEYVGGQAVEYFFGDAAEAMRDPEYERAEAEWANGKFLDAIQLMRDYLKRNPRELHAALRIAEIYEKDLKNPLAAALEYEEVLKHRLPPERWGWAAIHLCNLYSRLNRSDEALALLRRLAEQYPKTAGAKKARERLGIAEPEADATEKEAITEAPTELIEHTQVITMEERPPELEPRTGPRPAPPQTPAPAAPPKPSLPPGFRPKK
jgi:TolA-binding protein